MLASRVFIVCVTIGNVILVLLKAYALNDYCWSNSVRNTECCEPILSSADCALYCCGTLCLYSLLFLGEGACLFPSHLYTFFLFLIYSTAHDFQFHAKEQQNQ